MNPVRRPFVLATNATLDTLSCIIYSAAPRAFVHVFDAALLLLSAMVRLCYLLRGPSIVTPLAAAVGAVEVDPSPSSLPEW